MHLTIVLQSNPVIYTMLYGINKYTFACDEMNAESFNDVKAKTFKSKLVLKETQLLYCYFFQCLLSQFDHI